MLVAVTTPPLFHLYGDPPNNRAFDFIHIETIESRSSINNWTIRPHRHLNLYQLLLIQCGGGQMFYETSRCGFDGPSAIFVTPRMVHGFRFTPVTTQGWVLTFSEDVADALGAKSIGGLDLLSEFETQPVIRFCDSFETRRLWAHCEDLQEEALLGRPNSRVAMSGYLGLIAVGAMRLSQNLVSTGTLAQKCKDSVVQGLRQLIEQHYRGERAINFYAEKLRMTPDRLNDHVKRLMGVTAGHLIRQRILIEAKRQLVFTNEPINQIAFGLSFTDPSHFTRFFRRHTGTTPHSFRNANIASA
jgi:AraC family transcriptional activator of pobA